MSATPTTPLLLYWDEASAAFVQLPFPLRADSAALRSLIGFDDMRSGDEVVLRFLRLDVDESGEVAA